MPLPRSQWSESSSPIGSNLQGASSAAVALPLFGRISVAPVGSTRHLPLNGRSMIEPWQLVLTLSLKLRSRDILSRTSGLSQLVPVCSHCPPKIISRSYDDAGLRSRPVAA